MMNPKAYFLLLHGDVFCGLLLHFMLPYYGGASWGTTTTSHSEEYNICRHIYPNHVLTRHFCVWNVLNAPWVKDGATLCNNRHIQFPHSLVPEIALFHAWRIVSSRGRSAEKSFKETDRQTDRGSDRGAKIRDYFLSSSSSASSSSFLFHSCISFWRLNRAAQRAG